MISKYKRTLIKLNETRSTNDLVYDNERALTIANRLIAYSLGMINLNY
jgi:hypothetical protein